MKKLLIVLSAVLFLTQGVEAQEAPPPHRSPRTPVNQEDLPDRKPAPPSRSVEGQAMILDADKLRIADVDLRLFGIVPPQLSANFGPQARAALDNLVNGQNTSCMIRDRDHDGRFLATCKAGNTDLALELLRRGLAVTARGSLASTELAATYLATEQAAQMQRAGLWSTSIPPAASISATPVKTEAPKAEPAPVVDVKKEDKPVKTEKAEPKNMPDAVQSKVSSATIDASDLAPPDDETLAVPETTGFFARYQLLITGLIMLATALSIMGVISSQRRNEKREEMKAIAAALRGELMAARAVCQARLKTLAADGDEKNTTWPRIRATLYQAYVGRLGWLGAELARQVASIYGQSSDYAAYYNADEIRAETAPKKQALQTLVQHIEEVLPKLALIEQTGRLVNAPIYIPPVRTHTSAAPQTVSRETASPEKPAAVPLSATPLWETLRQFRERFADRKTENPDEQDYASIIEAEMAGVSFNEGEDEITPAPDNVTKLRETGS